MHIHVHVQSHYLLKPAVHSTYPITIVSTTVHSIVHYRATAHIQYTPTCNYRVSTTFHESPAEVGAGAISQLPYRGLGPVLVGSVHGSQSKVQVHLSVVGHQRQPITLLHCAHACVCVCGEGETVISDQRVL